MLDVDERRKLKAIFPEETISPGNKNEGIE